MTQLTTSWSQHTCVSLRCRNTSVKVSGLAIGRFGVLVPALTLTNCVVLGKILYLSDLQNLLMWNEETDLNNLFCFCYIYPSLRMRTFCSLHTISPIPSFSWYSLWYIRSTAYQNILVDMEENAYILFGLFFILYFYPFLF